MRPALRPSAGRTLAAADTAVAADTVAGAGIAAVVVAVDIAVVVVVGTEAVVAAVGVVDTAAAGAEIVVAGAAVGQLQVMLRIRGRIVPRPEIERRILRKTP